MPPKLRAKAQELGRQPLAIHQWVRNSIDFAPSYGAMQGADLTLQTRRGNAFDIASLEIALLRASDIPARYVYGTIELPATQAMNWVGGVTGTNGPNAALDLLGQGGIPSLGVVSGGKIERIRLEHVWVEAWVDYVPSRGAKHRQGDTWIPLDASFKQYDATPGLNLPAPPDAQTLLAQIQSGATVNETQGWAQNLNQASLNAALTAYQDQIKTAIAQANPSATVGDVLGTRSIRPETLPMLPGTLPYTTLAIGSKFATLPDTLRWKFRTELTAATGAALASLSQATPGLAGKKLTLSFVPASQADLDLINSYLPKPHADGSPIQPSELPSSLPGYLLKLKAEIRVDGQLVAQSQGSVGMGETLGQATAFFNPGTQRWDEGEPNAPIAGEYHALALDMQGTGQAQLAQLKTRLEQTQAQLQQYQTNPADPSPIQALTKEELAGDLLYAGILGYFASVDGAEQLAARANQNIVAHRLPSYGAFMAKAQPRLWFGIVRSVSFPGVAMDVDRVQIQAAAKDGNQQTRIAYIRQIGASASAFEHAVPEKLFADPAKPANDPTQPQGVSAVKAIALAAAQGQKIYTLNAQNQPYHQALLAEMTIDADAKAEIQNSLAAGMEVTTHQAEITVNGWTGSGYIILDPETGAGAYKISGGFNGAIFAVAMIFMALSIIVPALLAASGTIGVFAGILGAGLSFANFLDFVNKLETVSNFDEFNSLAAAKTLAAVVSLLGIAIKLPELLAKDTGVQMAIPLLLSGISFLTGYFATDQFRQHGCFLVFFDCR